MSKFLYPIRKLKIEPWIKYWLLKRTQSSILPKEYQQVDYIESSGTQYIDTGVTVNDFKKIIADIMFTAKTDNFLLGSRKDVDTRNAIGCNFPVTPSTWQMGYNNNWVRGTNQPSLNTKYNILYEETNNSSKLIIDDVVEININATITKPYDVNVGLFAMIAPYTQAGFFGGSSRFYNCKMYNNNDTLVRDFIPCYRKSDNVVGLYDLVNNVFYTNAGTGAFTYGEVV